LRWWIRIRKDVSGASATEYALTLAVIGGCVAVAAIMLGSVIGSVLNDMSQCIESHGNKCE